MQENKSNYFFLTLDFMDSKFDDLESINDNLISFFDLAEVDKECHAFVDQQGQKVNYFFRTESRKRPSQLSRIFDNNIPLSLENYTIRPGTKFSYNENVRRFSESTRWSNFKRPKDFMSYQAEDLSIFKDKGNFFPWQRSIYNMIFQSDGDFKSPDDRKIFVIYDADGNNGKSKFVKYLCWNFNDDIIRLNYGQAGQLRSALVNAGKRLVYLIDLPRTKGRSDDLSEILVVIEDLKVGSLTSPFYGKMKDLFMPPPFVFIFTNNHLPYKSLSKDRWECYQISSSRKLSKFSISKFLVKEKIKK